MMVLAANNVDWIQTIVIVAIVAMSALGSVANFLIRKLSPKKDVEERGAGGSRGNAPRPGAPTPPRPVARPLPPRSRPVARPTIDQPETARRDPLPIPDPLREVLAELLPDFIPPRKETPPPRPPVAPRRQPPAEPARVPTAAPLPQQAVRPERRQRTPDTTKGRGSLRFKPLVTGGSLEGTERTSESPADAARTPSVGNLHALLRASTPDLLRYAIVMSEVLGPPIALRDADPEYR